MTVNRSLSILIALQGLLNMTSRVATAKIDLDKAFLPNHLHFLIYYITICFIIFSSTIIIYLYNRIALILNLLVVRSHWFAYLTRSYLTILILLVLIILVCNGIETMDRIQDNVVKYTTN